MLKHAYILGCTEALTKLGAVSPELITRLAQSHGITEAEVMNRIAQGRAAVAKVPPPTPGYFERPTSPAAIRGNLQIRRVLGGLPFIGSQGDYYTHGRRFFEEEPLRQYAHRLGQARRAKLIEKLTEQGKVYERAPGAALPPLRVATPGEPTIVTPAAQRAAQHVRAAPLAREVAETVLHVAPRKAAPKGLAFAPTLLRRFAHI